MNLNMTKIAQIIKDQLNEFDILAQVLVTPVENFCRVSITGVLKHDNHEAEWSLGFDVSEGDVSDVVFEMPMFDIASGIPVVAPEKKNRGVDHAITQISLACIALREHHRLIAATAAFTLEFNDDIKDVLEEIHVAIGNELGW